jgi:hypothetical protein
MVFLLFGDWDGFIIAHFLGIVNGVLQEMNSLLSALRRNVWDAVHYGGSEKTKTPFWSDGVLFVICGRFRCTDFFERVDIPLGDDGSCT